METFSEVALILLGIVVFLKIREGTVGEWFAAKFFNAAEPAPVGPPDSPRARAAVG